MEVAITIFQFTLFGVIIVMILIILKERKKVKNNGSITKKKAQPLILHSFNRLTRMKQFGEKSTIE